MENNPSWGYPKREDLDGLLDAYSDLKKDYVEVLSRLEFLLENYVLTEDGLFTFPDGAVFPARMTEVATI